MATESDHLVPLSGGLAVRESLLIWLLDAEDRGIRFRNEPDGSLYVGPRVRVRDADLMFVRAHRKELAACVSYIESVARN